MPGHEYYRLPTVGVVNDFWKHADFDMMEGEGFHSDGAELLEFETYDGHKLKNGLMQQTGTLLVSKTQQNTI